MYYNAVLVMAASQENSPDILYRHCNSDADYAACVALQEATWGSEDVVPLTLLKAAQKVGGIVAGAFDSSGRMLGSVFGLTGMRDGQPTHWSHMLAVTPEARGIGIAYGLKRFQRDALLDVGIDRMYWTYDPLESINAHFNINRLGARPIEYVQDMYGGGGANLLHQGLGTDRFVVRWELRNNEAVDSTTNANDAQVLNEVTDEHWSVANPDDAGCVRIEVPQDIQALKKTRPEEARAWRMSTREAIQRCLDSGFAVTGFDRAVDHRCYYILESNTQ